MIGNECQFTLLSGCLSLFVAGAGGLVLQPLLYGSSSGNSPMKDCRMIEDKITQSRMDMRKIVLALDLSGCHGNSFSAESF